MLTDIIRMVQRPDDVEAARRVELLLRSGSRGTGVDHRARVRRDSHLLRVRRESLANPEGGFGAGMHHALSVRNDVKADTSALVGAISSAPFDRELSGHRLDVAVACCALSSPTRELCLSEVSMHRSHRKAPPS